MTKFSVHVDVTLSGHVEVEANSEEEARQIINNRVFQHYDLHNFYYFSKDIVDVEEVCSHCGCSIESGYAWQDKDENTVCEDCLIQQQAKDLGLVK